ncbi:MAG: DNA replication protein [Alphaproteobacteria bacterium]|nr:DNA replication protein [Alphaproteobacteria bacterium]
MNQQYHLLLPQVEAMSAEDFLPAPANEEAVAWLMQRSPQEWPSHMLVLCGPEGSGKTHLLSIWCEQQQAQRVLPGDRSVLSQIVNGDSPSHAFALDNSDQIVGHPEQEEWLQHFYNATKALGLPVLLTSRAVPALWGLALRDIETRLKSCLTVQLHEPDDELMRGLLLKLFRDRQLMVEAGVVEYLAQRVDRTGTAVGEIVAALDEASLQSGRKISIPFVQKLLAQHEPKAEDNGDQDA